jgi:hypothetical protein
MEDRTVEKTLSKENNNAAVGGFSHVGSRWTVGKRAQPEESAQVLEMPRFTTNRRHH